jgi:hypothetical protein
MHRYLETRTTTATSPTVCADLARHLLPRQHLGKTVVVCERPVVTMSVTRKYWLKLSRNLQRERSSTLNAEKILQLTYDITHMQHMEFSARPLGESPRADVFFLTPSQLEQLPTNCFSLYVVMAPSEHQLFDAIGQLPEHALVVDYSHASVMASAPLLPKSQLDQLVLHEWQKVEAFFAAQHLDIAQLASHTHRLDRLDEAIDVILNTGSRFLRVTGDFLEILSLAQPLDTPNSQQQLYDLLVVLNRRISALTPGILSQQFAQTLGDDESLLHDGATKKLLLSLAL